jgi:hypothetical protein
MSPQPSPISRGRFGLLIGLVFTLGVVLVGLSFLGRRAEIATPVAKPTQAPPAKGQVRVKLRSSASLNLDESKNVRPDAPELGPKDLAVFQDKAQGRFLALVKEMGYADESRVTGLTISAEMLMEKMGSEPRWKQFENEINTLALAWAGANQEERKVTIDRISAIYDEALIELRRRLSDLR